jgi:hypothetical protein
MTARVARLEAWHPVLGWRGPALVPQVDAAGECVRVERYTKTTPQTVAGAGMHP